MNDYTRRIAGVILNALMIVAIVVFASYFTFTDESRFDTSAMVAVVLCVLSSFGLVVRMVYDVPIVLTTTSYLVSTLEVVMVTDEIVLPIIVLSFLFLAYSFLLIPKRVEFDDIVANADKTIPDIDLAEDEVLVRRYVISVLDFRLNYLNAPMAEPPERSKYTTSGTFYITNRRLIYKVNTDSIPRLKDRVSDRFNEQLLIKDVKGVDLVVGRRKKYSVTAYLLMAMGLLSIVMVASDYDTMFKFLPGLCVLIGGINWKVGGGMDPESTMVLGLKTKKGKFSLAVSEMSRGYVGSVKFSCRPTESFAELARDIGALVLDFQKYGDEAIPKWKRTDDY